MNDQPKCKWDGGEQPRILPQRHRDECRDEACSGCLPCSGPHCVVCGVEHSTGACAGCVGAVREDLGEIRRLSADLPAEVEVRGVAGEAFSLLGPTADPEARGHLEASVKAGRVPPEYLDTYEAKGA